MVHCCKAPPFLQWLNVVGARGEADIEMLFPAAAPPFRIWAVLVVAVLVVAAVLLVLCWW